MASCVVDIQLKQNAIDIDQYSNSTTMKTCTDLLPLVKTCRAESALIAGLEILDGIDRLIEHGVVHHRLIHLIFVDFVE